MSPIDSVLPQLTKVRRRQSAQWSACCPAHDDKGPSLSIRETPDGAVLLHCFAGCEVANIVAAIGLELQNLFPPRDRPTATPSRIAKVLTAGQALDLLHDEAQFVCMCFATLVNGGGLSDADWQRLLQAAGRIAYIRDEVMS